MLLSKKQVFTTLWKTSTLNSRENQCEYGSLFIFIYLFLKISYQIIVSGKNIFKENMSPNQIFSNKTWGGKILILNYKENCFEDIYGPPNSKIISITFTSMYLVLFSFLILYLFYEL